MIPGACQLHPEPRMYEGSHGVHVVAEPGQKQIQPPQKRGYYAATPWVTLPTQSADWMHVGSG